LLLIALPVVTTSAPRPPTQGERVVVVTPAGDDYEYRVESTGRLVARRRLGKNMSEPELGLRTTNYDSKALRQLARRATGASFGRKYVAFELPGARGKRPSVTVFSGRSGRTVAHIDNATEPSVSLLDDELSFIQTDPRTGDCLRAIDLRTMAPVLEMIGWPNPTGPRTSPSGRYVAVEYHLSRPVTGDTMYVTRHHRDITSRYQWAGYLPIKVVGWSNDERWLAVQLRTADPSNSGSWLRSELGVISVDGKHRLKLGSGEQARFSEDGRRVLWLRTDHGRSDLIITDLRTEHHRVVAHDVGSFRVAIGS